MSTASERRELQSIIKARFKILLGNEKRNRNSRMWDARVAVDDEDTKHLAKAQERVNRITDQVGAVPVTLRKKSHGREFEDRVLAKLKEDGGMTEDELLKLRDELLIEAMVLGTDNSLIKSIIDRIPSIK